MKAGTAEVEQVPTVGPMSVFGSRPNPQQGYPSLLQEKQQCPPFTLLVFYCHTWSSILVCQAPTAVV